MDVCIYMYMCMCSALRSMKCVFMLCVFLCALIVSLFVYKCVCVCVCVRARVLACMFVCMYMCIYDVDVHVHCIYNVGVDDSPQN